MKFLNDWGGSFFTSIYKPNINTYNCKLLMVKFSNTTPLPSRIFWGGMNFFDTLLSMNFFNDGGGGSLFYKYLQTKHKKWIFSATVYLTRKKFYISWKIFKSCSF